MKFFIKIFLFTLFLISSNTAYSQETLLTLKGFGDKDITFTAAKLEAIGMIEFKDIREVTSSSGVQRTEITYKGVLLKTLLTAVAFEKINPNKTRATSVVAIASDDYSATFSWGELYNTPIGDHILIITHQDGVVLDAKAGPLAIRSFRDLRNGPRHIRNLVRLEARF